MNLWRKTDLTESESSWAGKRRIRFVPILIAIGAGFSQPAVSSEYYIPASFEFVARENLPDAYVIDLNYLKAGFAEHNKSFSYTAGSEEVFRSRIDGLIERVNELTFGDFAMGISHAIAAVDDGHTGLDAHRALRHIPVRFSWFGNELRIIRAHKDYESLLGARVLSIVGRSPIELLDLLEDFVGGSHEHTLAASPDFLDSPDALDGMNVMPPGDTLELKVELRRGGQKTVSLPGTVTMERDAVIVGWRDRVPNHQLTEPDGWVHVLNEDTNLPVYLEDGNDLYEQVELHDDPDLFYVRIRLTYDADGYRRYFYDIRNPSGQPEIRQYLLQTLSNAVAREPKYRHAIVDLRFNPGGSLLNTLEFTRGLPRTIADDGKIFVITNRNSFSAAIVTTALLRAFGGERTIVVGEHAGDRERFWAERTTITLPNSHLEAHSTHGYHDWKKGCAGEPHCWFGGIFNVEGGSLQPDIPVDLNFDDYASGHDPMMEAIRNHIAEFDK